MHLLRPGIAVFAIQLYWATIVFIGWTLVQTVLKVSKGSFISDWRQLPIAAKFVISTALAFVLFSVFTLIGYSLSLPPWWLNVTYVASLAYAVFYVIKNRQGTSSFSAKSFIGAILDIKLLSPLGIFIILGGIDLAFTFFIGGFMGADGFVHISKIRHLTLDGFTLNDAYYGTVPETRHTLSVLHTLMAVPSSFGINPITSWYASAAFLKLVEVGTVFYFAWRLLFWTKKMRVQYAALAAILPLGLYNGYFISYPSFFVAVWVMLFTIALFDIADRKNLYLLLIASMLIAFTHPLAAIACALLLCLVGVSWLIIDRRLYNKKNILVIFASFAALLSTPLFDATLPNRMTESAKNFSATDMAYNHLGSLEAFKPTAIQYFATPWAKSLPITILSLFGIVGLFAFIKDKRYRCVIGCCVLFVPIILYDPLVFTPLAKHLPIWAVARFSVADQLVLLMAFFGLLYLSVSILRLLKLRLPDAMLTTLLLVATLVIFACTQTYGAVNSGQERHVSMYDQQKMVLADMQNIEQVLPNDKYATVLAERTWDSFIIPVVAPLHVVAINDNNSTPAADMVDRSACYEKLYTTLDPALMKQAGVDYVLADKSEVNFYALAISDPDLHILKQNDARALFKLQAPGVKAANNSICHFNE